MPMQMAALPFVIGDTMASIKSKLAAHPKIIFSLDKSMALG